MSRIPTLPGITSTMVETPRLAIHVLSSGPDDGTPVLFVHGNGSSATFWEELMLALPDGFRAIAPDLRGYGDTEDLLVDATRGCGDWVADLLGLFGVLGIEQAHVIGHSLGGTVVFNLVAEAPERFLSATVVAPGSPYGFGGTKGPDGVLCFPDAAGTGGGFVNPDFVRLMGEGDRSSDSPNSPRNVMNGFYWKAGFVPAREEELLSSLLSEKTGPDRYAGDAVPSENWPGLAPGRFGPINAISPAYVGDSVTRFINAGPKPFVLWVRGDADAIVGDGTFFEVGTLGAAGILPGWPGAEVFPPQPMLAQTRAVLEAYGPYREVVLADCGHSPYLEKPAEFQAAWFGVLTRPAADGA